MAIIPNFKLTTKGVELLNRVIAEQKTLKFTKFEIGDGSFTGDIKTLQRLVSKFKEFAVIETNVLEDGQTNIKGYFDNKGFLTSKRLREFGVYAQIGDEILTEVLFSYTNAGDTADLIPAESENFFSRTLSAINKTGDVENVTFNVDLINCKRDFNTVAELKAADWLVAGDKVNLWGNLALGDVKKTSKIITSENAGIPLLNGLYAKDYTSFLQDGGYKKDAARLNRDIVNNSGLLEDLEIEYIQDAGTKKNGYCYKDRNQQGIFKCFKDYTGTSNDANYFYKFDNNELLGKLQNLSIFQKDILTRTIFTASDPNAMIGDVYLAVSTSGGENESFDSRIIIIPPSGLITSCRLNIYKGTADVTYDGATWRWIRTGTEALGELKLYKLQLSL